MIEGWWHAGQALPAPLAALAGRMEACRLLRGDQLPNHCLVNSYAGGAPCPVHQDGPLYSNHVPPPPPPPTHTHLSNLRPR